MIRVRIAPSPTGPFHLGTARAALYNYLFAKNNGGQFVLRIEDTDLERSSKEFEKDIFDGLAWLGIVSDEGPVNGGKYGPYRQSERGEFYTKYIKKLYDDGHLYHCFCSAEKLEEERKGLMDAKKAPVYQATCRSLSDDEVKEKLDEGVKSMLRFRAPDKKIEFEDLIRGKVEFDTSLIGDIIVARDMDTPLYNLAVVIDDSTMEISHVLRGEDHVSNTPKQIMLLEALEFKRPVYGHFPLILNEDKSKLSKRKNKVSLLEYKKEGYLPSAMLNMMALLGWNAGDDREVFSLSELEKEFSIERVHKGGAIFNVDKLNWLNQKHASAMDLGDLRELALPYFIKAGFFEESEDGILKMDEYSISGTDLKYSRTDFEKMLDLERSRVFVLSEFPNVLHFFFRKELDFELDLLLWKDMRQDDAKKGLEFVKDQLSSIDDFSASSLEEKIIGAIKDADMKNGGVLWPFRVAVSGQKNSPGPFDIASILGKELTLARIDKAISSLN